jgi:hypothetical protein
MAAIAAMQHTSFDVWAYVRQRIKIIEEQQELDEMRQTWAGSHRCVILRRTLLGFCSYIALQQRIEFRSRWKGRAVGSGNAGGGQIGYERRSDGRP